jgi:large subunit ribosomal protein L6
MVSKIGRKVLIIPDGVDFKFTGDVVVVTGRLGSLVQKIPKVISVVIFCNSLAVIPNSVSVDDVILGTTFSLLENMFHGVSFGFSKTLLLKGIGYRATINEGSLILRLGYSHEIIYKIPNTLTFKVTKNTEIEIFGVCKQEVGNVSAAIREFRVPESYKGKGICYVDELVLLKEIKKK